MTIKSLTELKTYFETDDKPTQEQFEHLIDGFNISSTNDQLDIAVFNQISSNSAVKNISSNTGTGNITLTSNPQITQGVDGQQLIIVGNSDTDTITLTNNNGLILSNSFTATTTTSLYLLYLTSKSKWIEVARTDENSGNFSVKDEGIEISSTTNSLNFIGANVIASTSTPKQVDITISGISGVNSEIVESFTITPTDIINKYITLSNTPIDISNVIIFIEDGLKGHYNTDYNIINNNQINWNGYSWDGLLASGDTLTVLYWY